jgi:pentatricopeptide repeat protein
MNYGETSSNDERSTATNKEKTEIQDISKAFANQNLRPNIRTYNTLLKALRRFKNFDKCMEVIRSMKKQNIQPDTVTINTLVDAAVSTGNLYIAEDVST